MPIYSNGVDATGVANHFKSAAFLALLLAGAPYAGASGWASVERGPLIEMLRLDGMIEAVQESIVSAQTMRYYVFVGDRGVQTD